MAGKISRSGEIGGTFLFRRLGSISKSQWVQQDRDDISFSNCPSCENRSRVAVPGRPIHFPGRNSRDANHIHGRVAVSAGLP
jgi:hypothetical protein